MGRITHRQGVIARILRHNLTPSETILWFRLRGLRSEGIRFRRQQTIGNYIVDFVCLEKHVIVEVDGGQHNESPAITLDKQRTNWLESQGYCLLRFWNNDISSNIDGVISKILENAG